MKPPFVETLPGHPVRIEELRGLLADRVYEGVYVESADVEEPPEKTELLFFAVDTGRNTLFFDYQGVTQGDKADGWVRCDWWKDPGWSENNAGMRNLADVDPAPDEGCEDGQASILGKGSPLFDSAVMASTAGEIAAELEADDRPGVVWDSGSTTSVREAGEHWLDSYGLPEDAKAACDERVNEYGERHGVLVEDLDIVVKDVTVECDAGQAMRVKVKAVAAMPAWTDVETMILDFGVDVR